MQAKCQACRKLKELISFAPNGGERQERKKQRFMELLGQLSSSASEERDEIRANIDSVRVKQCLDCRQKTSNSPSAVRLEECRAYLKHIQTSTPCVDCGRTECISFTPNDRNAVYLSQVTFWASHGGVESMMEATKSFTARCEFCRCTRLHNQYEHHEMDAYIHLRKRAHGECAECNLGVTDQTMGGFQWAHYDCMQKVHDAFEICTQFKQGIVSLEEAMRLFDEEERRCRLLCVICHRKETNQRNARSG